MPRLPLLEGPNEQPGHDISSHQNIHVSSMPSYNPGSSDVNLYAHKTHVNSHISQCKLTNSENGTPSGQWSTNRNSDMCYHHQITSDVPEDMTWPTTDLYDGPWPLEHHPYIHGRQNTASGITGHGLAMPNSCHTTIAVPHSPTAQQSCNSVSGPRQTIGQAQHQQTFSDYGYTSNCGAVYSDTEAGSFTQQPTSGPSLSNIHIHSGIAGSASPQSTSEDRAAIEASLHYSDARNVFLIDCKRRGLSYKDIKRMGGFKEAESTLRGRFRTLTKAKDQRVRKPKWQDKDVSDMTNFHMSWPIEANTASLSKIKLLCEAVLVCSESPEAYTSIVQLSMSMHQPPKVSWKKVAEYIWSHGGSYYFGNATCKKKWCEIHDIKL